VNRNICTLVVLMLLLVVSSSGQTNGNNGTSDSPNSEIKSPDLSKWLALMLAAEGGGGLLSSEPTAYGGAKLGLGPGVLSLGYDRIQARNGFSIDCSALLPVVRFPGPQRDETKNFVRISRRRGYPHSLWLHARHIRPLRPEDIASVLTEFSRGRQRLASAEGHNTT
jgi:hypothetical protein